MGYDFLGSRKTDSEGSVARSGYTARTGGRSLLRFSSLAESESLQKEFEKACASLDATRDPEEAARQSRESGSEKDRHDILPYD